MCLNSLEMEVKKKKEEEKKWTTSMGILTGKLMEIDSETLTCHIVYLQKI